MVASTSLFLHSVPDTPADVNVKHSHTSGIYVGTSLKLTCTVILHPNVDNSERVTTSWTKDQDIILGQQYTTTPARGSGQTYSSTLTISPLSRQTNGMYICTATVGGESNSKTASSNIGIVNALRKLCS